MNKIEITVLSARVLDALSGRGLKAKTVHEFERYGTRRIVKHCLGKGQILYPKETVQNFVWNERAKQESGTLPHYQWGITRRAAVYLDQMAEYGKIQDEPIRPWEAEHNPLFQAISCNPSNSMKVIDIICRTRDAVMQLELSDKTKTNYIYRCFVPYIFTKDEIERLFSAVDCTKESSESPLRHLVMPVLFRLLYTCGLRVSEALHLKVADVDLDAGVLAIYGAKETKNGW